eukprot:3693585-Pyramimonas_sp.AAC.1
MRRGRRWRANADESRMPRRFCLLLAEGAARNTGTACPCAPGGARVVNLLASRIIVPCVPDQNDIGSVPRL